MPRVLQSKAETWQYIAPNGEDGSQGVYNGWSKKKRTYRHFTCGDYFSKLGEKHKCIPGSIKMVRDHSRDHDNSAHRLRTVCKSQDAVLGDIVKAMYEMNAFSPNHANAEVAYAIAEKIGFGS